MKSVPAFKPTGLTGGPSEPTAEKASSCPAGSGWSSEASANGTKEKKKKNSRKSQVSPKVNTK